MFDYFLGDRVDRDIVRNANNSVVSRVDEIWVFGQEIADGVLAEIDLANASGKPVKFFSIATRAREIREIEKDELRFEAELRAKAGEDVSGLHDVVRGARRLSTVLAP